MSIGIYNPFGQQTVKTEPTARYCETFEASAPSTDSDWYLSLGSGQTATKNSGTGGAYYTFASGTTANSETIFLLKRIFTGEFNAILAFDRSAQTANTNLYVELVEIDPTLIYSSPATAVVTSGTDAPVKNARNAFNVFFSGNSGTPSAYGRFGGATSYNYTSSHFVGLTSIAAPQGSAPNQTAGNIYEIKANNYGITINRTNVPNAASASGIYAGTPGFPSSGINGARYDPTKYYTVRVRVLNGGTNPASSVNFNFYRCELFANNVVAVDLFRGLNLASNGQGSPQAFTLQQSLPVAISNSPLTVSGSGSFTVASASVSSATTGITIYPTVCVFGDESSTNLGSAGVFTSTTTAVISNYNGQGWIRVSAYSDVASATNGMQLQMSNSAATTWYTVAQTTVNASTYTVLEHKAVLSTGSFVGSRWRVVYTNGATAQSVFALRWIGSSL